MPATKKRTNSNDDHHKNNQQQHQIKKNKKPRQVSMFSFLSSPSSSSTALPATSTKESNEEEKKEKRNTEKAAFKIYCDLDGVLVDFAAGVKQVCNGKLPEEIDTRRMWSAICSTKSFYAELPWTDDGKELWDAIKTKKPSILTGVPMFKTARTDKFIWCQRELGVKVNHLDMAASKREHDLVFGSWRSDDDNFVNVITCWSANKHEESGERRILIDDTEKLANNWIERGGIFIHHTNTKTTLEKLREKGVL